LLDAKERFIETSARGNPHPEISGLSFTAALVDALSIKYRYAGDKSRRGHEN